MLAVAVPGAQRVFVRHIHRQRALSNVGGLVRCLPPEPVGSDTAGVTALARRLTTVHVLLDGGCAPRSLGRVPPRRRSGSSAEAASSSSLGMGLGALLTAGGLLLLSQGLPSARDPVAMEGAASNASAAGCERRGGADRDATETDHQRPTTDPPPTLDEDANDGFYDDGGGGDGGDEESEEGGGDGEGEVLAQGTYKYYILSEEEAAAEATGLPKVDPSAGIEDGRLKRRYRFIIIGEGAAADAAVESILRMQPEAEILFLSDQKPSPMGGSNTHTGGYESDFRLLKADLLASFNQWRRHLTFRRDDFSVDERGVKGGDDEPGAAARVGECRSEYGLAREKRIRYHTYQPHGLVIEPESRCVRLLLDGIEVYYDKCLIANSGRPRERSESMSVDGEGKRPPDTTGVRSEIRVGQALPSESVNRLMSLRDFVSLEVLAKRSSAKHVTVLGSGFVGCEVALALVERGKATGMRVSQVYSESAPMQNMLPGYLAEYVQEQLAKAGVMQVGTCALTNLRYNTDIGRVVGQLEGRGDRRVQTDYVVVASTRVDAKVDAASDSGLEIDKGNGGIVVNGFFEAGNGLYAAGSAASFYDPVMGRQRLENHDHCVNSGLFAGYNMAASLRSFDNEHYPSRNKSSNTATGPPPAPHPRSYDHLPSWRSNLPGCGVVMDGVGEIDPSLRTTGLWVNGADEQTPTAPCYKRGVVYYTRGEKVVGILLLNLSDHLDTAREVLRSQPKISTVRQLKALIMIGATESIRVVETPASVAGNLYTCI